MKKSLLAGAAATGLVLLTAPAAGAMTYTLEALDFDGVFGLVQNQTQQMLGGTLCPCTKIPYPADGLSDQQGVTAITETPLTAGDTVLGYSLGSVVASAYLNANTPPPGVNFILLADTSNPNGLFAATGLLPLFGGGVPANTPDPMTIISRQYDGWADFPQGLNALNILADLNAIAGMNLIHSDYTEVQLGDPANVTWQVGNVTYVMVPTQDLPINDWLRQLGLNNLANQLDAIERPIIDSAYPNVPQPTAAQIAESTSEQAKTPSPVKIFGTTEPVVTLNADPPSTAPVLASSTNQTPTPAKVATNLSTSASIVSHPTVAARPGGVSSVQAGSEVRSPRRGTNAEATKPLATKPAEAASHVASKPSLHH
jgi:PE-PPE domain